MLRPCHSIPAPHKDRHSVSLISQIGFNQGGGVIQYSTPIRLPVQTQDRRVAPRRDEATRTNHQACNSSVRCRTVAGVRPRVCCQ